jgi:hypothetical protein
VSVNVAGKDPHILAPLIAAAQVVNVSLPGHAPDLQAPAEDLRLFDAGLVSSWTGGCGVGMHVLHVLRAWLDGQTSKLG